MAYNVPSLGSLHANLPKRLVQIGGKILLEAFVHSWKALLSMSGQKLLPEKVYASSPGTSGVAGDDVTVFVGDRPLQTIVNAVQP